MKPYDTIREQFLESNDRFQQAMLEAIRAHQAGVLMFVDLLTAVEKREDDLQESVDELKRLTLDQGEQIRALRIQLNGTDTP
jgi:hypothetical protein